MEGRRRFLSLEDACESVFMDSDSESEPLGDLQDVHEDALASGDDSDILDVRAETEDVSCQGGQLLDPHLDQ